MKDFVGNELQIGDKVVYCRSRKSGMDMIKTVVVGFTEKMVKVEKLQSWDDKDYTVVSASNCILYQER